MSRILLIIGLTASLNAFAGDSLLRVACDEESAGAEVSINGKFKGECPIDLSLPEGTHQINVIKRVDDEKYRTFNQTLRLGDGVVKRIDVSLGGDQLTPLGREREKERQAQLQRQAEEVRIEQERREAARLNQERERARKAEEDRQMAIAEQRRKMQTPGYTFKDCDICPEMIVVPSGDYDMGSNENDNEKPVHRVNVRGFAIAKTEISFNQFSKLYGNYGFCQNLYSPSVKDNCSNLDRPAFTNFNMAQFIAKKLTQITGKNYRLPSESEWEYACRAGSNSKYCGSENYKEVAVCVKSMFSFGNTGHLSVATKKPNAWGIYDMSGNAGEWTADCWNDDYSGAPINSSARADGDCSKRVVRGGLAYFGAMPVCSDDTTSTVRNHASTSKDSLYHDGAGLRVVRDIE
jgi:formylglycine-generating enzyme required for sulfatase activity